jgi:RNA polymerase sigma-70 factor (ECF subfamily)
MSKGTGSDCGNRLVDLLVATARRDQSAFAQLYEATSGELYGVALRILRRRDLAEDVVQEAYLRIWNHAERFDPARGSAMTWMAAIVRHLAIDMARSPAGQPQASEADLLALPADTPHPLDEISLAQKRRRAFTILRDLDPLKRRLIIAAYLHGESREQLARRFGAPVNTIKTWLRRAVLELRASLDEDAARGVA